ncbi:MAG: thioredoxin family protein [Armatimonadetes bacterium]|nr:thioredoxin family protein [Armatimonadota bacterium]
MQPVVHGLEKDWASKVTFLNFNTDTDDGGKLAQEFGVQSIPYFVFYKNKKVADTITGGTSAGELEKRLKEITAP